MERTERLKQILDSFGAYTEEITETIGNTLTLYEVRPSLGTRVSRIRNLKDEIAAGLGVSSVRIIAPLQNGLIGIEVPNESREIVPLADILRSGQFVSTRATLPLAIGRTIDNDVFVADLADMPHLLIAGATGQGKSVCLNVMLLSLMNKKTPDELKLVLIDPKKVELSAYEKVARPYLASLNGLSPIITEADHAQMMLDAMCRLMEKRYTMLNEKGVRNIAEYNDKASTKMEYYVVVIDEFGDLIMQAGREMERLICRLAQKARAVGIHLIISTQRPDTKIVTGNIKANFPTRIAFRTTTGVDSRVILDQIGAEKLMGKGDMIYFSGPTTRRIQCAYVSTEEVLASCEQLGTHYSLCRQKIIKVVQEQQSYDMQEWIKKTFPQFQGVGRWHW